MNWGVLLAYFFIILFWTISATSRSKNKNKKAQRKDGAPQPIASVKAEKKRAAPRREAAQKAAPRAAMERPLHEEIHEGDDPCHPRMGGFDDCGEHEGDDPCHPGMERSPISESLIEETMIGTEEREQDMRRLVLEGIVMSEVLKRPGERRR